MPRHDKKVIIGVDVVRFAAATMVMCSHLCTSSWADPNAVTYLIVGGRTAFPELFAFTWFGWVGVDVFFVISGLVIAYSAEGASALTFARSRFLRLYPAAWICATLTAVTILALGIDTHRHVLEAWLGAIVLFPFPPYIDPVYWTLGIEMAFYGLVFLLLAFRNGHRLEHMALILGAISSAYWVLGASLAPDFLSSHFGSRRFDLSLVAPGCCFAAGTMAYVIARKGLSPLRLLAMAVFVAAALVQVRFRSAMMNPDQPAVTPQLVFIGCTMLVFVSLRGIVSASSLTARLVRMIGLATYPLYLFHQIVGAAIMKMMLAQGRSGYTALATAMVLCVIGSLIIAILLEPPVRSAVRKFLLWQAGVAPWSRLRLPAAALRKVR